MSHRAEEPPAPPSEVAGAPGRRSAGGPAGTSPTVQLALATVGFAVNFWAWALISPLGAAYKEDLGLTDVEQSIVVAIPVIVGSLGRIPVGALTDRLGAHVMFPVVSVLTIVPVLFIALVADSLAMLVIGGFLLGIGGTAFAVGVPFVNAWYPPARRGTAIGIFGMGMGGTAISAFTTLRLAETWGRATPFVVVAVVLAVFAVVAWLLLRDAPGRSVAPAGGMLARTWATLRLKGTMPLAWLYAVGFGGFVAFSVYLPTFLVNAYDLTPSDAALRTAGFVVLAVVMRPVGGALSDRLGAIGVSVVCFGVVAVLAGVVALGPALVPLGTIGFLGLAAALGASSGATFALVAKVAPADKVGGVTGLVGAAGGLGGFIPPLIMGAVYQLDGTYGLGLGLLALTALLTVFFTLGPVRRAARPS
ncbi:major facilitator superfamily MFS_1 [Beutenbergia cavernae DSM 12333]|uniref:Major facilitator superfamily MFS_1 n=1 Tax=Beutenbergia cavernae (strain ATCC BAA-8 / DSM 12333 / CCUG 43141 / JCM 11478 / NBRC 16432 / NCIMB 13614 / HKI 0122) TaxID=471853 RepID=C5BYF2_BEUC1|nr:MFS transporter [Beutenbergia cavernae]ACQ81052.1 major facilitator superfamily MFS_1 [Beutenbergia cavernae DSM 12333]